MEPPGSEPVEEDRIEEPAHGGSNSDASSNGPPSGAVPPPPRVRTLDLERPRREQAGGGAAAAGVSRKGKEIADPSPPSSSSSSSSSTHSLDNAIAATLRAGPLGGMQSTSAAGGRESTSTADGKARATWSDPLVAVAETSEEPDAAARPLDSRLVFDHRLIERLAREQAAVDEANELWRHQVVPDAAGQPFELEPNLVGQRLAKEQEKLSQVKVVVKVKPKQDKLGINWSQIKNKIFHREGREICSEHVNHQTHPITEVRRHHKLASDEANHLDAYSECRSVIEVGECFYRSFIFSYLEQVIDRQDTDEERRLLRVVDMEHLHHGALRWNLDFSRSSRAFKNLIEKVMRWKSHGRWKGMESTSSYRKEELLEFFSEYDTTQDIFIFLRSVVAIQICCHSEVYEQLIPGLRGNYDLEDWCFQRVTPARRFTDHVMMLALARAFEVPLSVERVRGGYDPDIYTGPGVPGPRVTLLYSANHYEIIYPRAPSAENSSYQASQREDPADQS